MKDSGKRLKMAVFWAFNSSNAQEKVSKINGLLAIYTVVALCYAVSMAPGIALVGLVKAVLSG
jgi:hypothetical protein